MVGDVGLLKVVTSIRVDGDLIKMAQAHNIIVSELVETTLRAYLEQYQNEEIQELKRSIQETDLKLQELRCKYSTLASEQQKILIYSATLKKKEQYFGWLEQYKEITKYRPEELKAFLELISKKTNVPCEYVQTILNGN